MRRTVAVIATLILLSLLAFRPLAAELSDAQLIGEWAGTWTGALHGATGAPATATPRGVKNTGEYRLTITKVEGGRVYGRVDQPGLNPSQLNVVATLDKNVLSFGNDRYRTELTVAKDLRTMTGTRLGGQVPWQISLQKRK